MIRGNSKLSPAAAAMMAQAPAAGADDVFERLLAQARERVQGQMTPAQVEDPDEADMALAQDLIRPLVEGAFSHSYDGGARPLGDPGSVTRQILDAIFGFGPLAPYLADEEVEEVIVDGPDQVWVIHAGRGKELTGARFRSANDVANFVNRAASGGRWLDKANPKLDARMRDGSRLHAVMEPLTVNVPIAVTIRRHRLVARTLDDLVSLGTITSQVRAFLDLAIGGRLNVVVAGGTASGKSNLLNAMCNGADDGDRFVVVEDTPELQIEKDDVIQMTTRGAAEDARGWTMADLVVEALRMRPDRIITGEARGPEVVDVLMAANTGHDGQMLTVHANSTRDVIGRLETMYLLRGADVPLVAVRRQIADAFQLILFVRRVTVGGCQRRYVTEVAEMQPSQFMEGDKVVVQNIFEDEGRGLAWTGYYPQRLAERLAGRGVELSMNFFRGGA